MKRGIFYWSKISLLFLVSWLFSGYCFAQNVDLSVTEINMPKNIFLKQKVPVSFTLANNSDMAVADCSLEVESDDGSKLSQQISLPKSSTQKIDMLWVPLKAGKVNFKVTLKAPKGIQDPNQDNNQLEKSVEVLVRK